MYTIELFESRGVWKTDSFDPFCNSCFLLTKILIGRIVSSAIFTVATLKDYLSVSRQIVTYRSPATYLGAIKASLRCTSVGV